VIVSLWHESCIAPIFSVRIVVSIVSFEKSAHEYKLCWVHCFFIYNRLACFEEIFIIRSENVLIKRDPINGCHCVTDMEAICIGNFLVVLM